MNNVFKIIKRDFKGIFKSALAILLVAAIAILPALYAWLNLYACWDPYKNVQGIHIAIYTEDQDYTMENGRVINMSRDMMEELRSESDIGWTLVDTRDEAIDGVYDGTYYASVVIEKDFTKSMFDFDNVGENEPTVHFYQNQKKNAIATRMTDSASNTLKRCMSETYIKALMFEVFGHFNGWDDDLGDLDQDVDDSETAFSILKTNMENYEKTLDVFIRADNLLMNSLDETDVMVDNAISSINGTVDTMNQQNEIIKEIQKDLKEDVDDATESLTTLQSHMDDLSAIMKRISETNTLNDMEKMIKDTQILLKDTVSILRNLQKTLYATAELDDQIGAVGVATCDSVTYLLNQTETLLDFVNANYADLTSLQNNLKYTVNAALKENSTVYGDATVNTTTWGAFTAGNVANGQSPTDAAINGGVATIILVNTQLTPTYAAIASQMGNPTGLTTQMAIALMANGWSQEKLADYKVHPEKYSSELGLTAVNWIANSLYSSNAVKASAASILQTYQKVVYIQNRAGNLQKQYQALESDLPKVMNDAGGVLGALGATSAKDSINALSVIIRKDLHDAEQSLGKLTDLGGSGAGSQADIDAAIKKVYSTRATVATLRGVFTSIDVESPEVEVDELADSLEDLEKRLDEILGALEKAQKLLDTTGEATAVIAEVNTLSQSTIDFMNNTLWPQADNALNQMEDVMDEISELLIHSANTMTDGKKVLDGVSLTMLGANNSLGAVQKVLGLLAGRINPILEDIDEIQDAEIISDLRTLLGLDPDAVSDYFASPVDTYTESVYTIDNYGSGMAPFYTSLAIWIGNIILGAIFKAQPNRRGLKKPKTWQLFAGRYFLFFIINEVQALIIMLGDLYILKIQCENPGLFLLTGAFASMAFSMLIYALILSFGILGKAASVLLFILQIAGSGGTYPIELLPTQFQALHVFLPFDYSIGAMRAAIAGTYHNDVYIDLGILALMIVMSLLVGLNSKTFRGFTDYMEEQMEESNLLV